MRIVKGKTKTAAQFISHCNAPSQRDQLVQKLQSLGIDVDIYGSCGNLSCPIGSNACDDMLNTTYKFYFAFENNLCSDYLTEKLFRTMSYFVVPVIFSGVNLRNFLPPNSYIDVNSFKTTEDLAKHLKFLSENPAEILKYFIWKKWYKVINGDDEGDVTRNHACLLCQKLNDPDLYLREKTLKNLKEWVSTDACRGPSITI
jgi:alpha-1,3-fucosyltransferase